MAETHTDREMSAKPLIRLSVHKRGEGWGWGGERREVRVGWRERERGGEGKRGSGIARV